MLQFNTSSYSPTNNLSFSLIFEHHTLVQKDHEAREVKNIMEERTIKTILFRSLSSIISHRNQLLIIYLYEISKEKEERVVKAKL